MVDTDKEVLTLREVAERLRCSRSHVAKLVNGGVRGLPPLAHVAMGRRKVVRREWLESWLDERKAQC
jgi:excisionase family DNA binding protein